MDKCGLDFNYRTNLETDMLVKLVNGCSVNPDNIKHFFVEQKNVSGKKTFIVQG